MKIGLPENRLCAYLIFCLPFIFAYVSWHFFPVLTSWIATQIFSYSAEPQAPSLPWYIATRFFYTWYTFLVIGVAGVWILVAIYVRVKQNKHEKPSYPMVSFVIPAYNEEKNISRCINSLFKCIEKYPGLCEIIVVDDGSTDCTYEIAWAAIELNRKKHPKIRAKVVRHSISMGKIEAVKTGTNKAVGNLIAIVDADSYWTPETLVKLVDYMLLNVEKFVIGYVHPTDGNKTNACVILQRLEYGQWLGLARCAQSLGDKDLVVSGAIGVYDAENLRKILGEKGLRSVTDDLELKMHKKGAAIGYICLEKSMTGAPSSLSFLWNQRLQWFTGWFHNTLGIHRDIPFKKSWLTVLLWYCYIFEYGGAFIDLATLFAFPFLFWFAPDRVLFLFNLLIFVSYGLLMSIVNQAIALKYAYNSRNHEALLFYTPLYPILRFINVIARITSIINYSLGNRGKCSALKSY